MSKHFQTTHVAAFSGGGGGGRGEGVRGTGGGGAGPAASVPAPAPPVAALAYPPAQSASGFGGGEQAAVSLFPTTFPSGARNNTRNWTRKFPSVSSYWH